MKKRMKMSSLLSVIFGTIMSCTVWAQQTNDVGATFHTAYAEWKEYLRTNTTMDVMVRSSIPSGTFYDNEPFRKIVALGVPALPQIADKISEDRLLLEAFRQITKWEYHVVRTGDRPDDYRWTVEEFPQMSKKGGPPDRLEVWNHWWKEGRFKTGERFAELYGKWKSLKAEKKDKEAEEIYQRIVDLGIPVLPYLLDNVEQETEFVSAISKLSDGDLAQGARATDCKNWWEKNKQKFELPGDSGDGTPGTSP